MKIYRMSVTFVLSGLLVGAVIAILYSIAKPRPFVTFMTVEGFFALLALLSWASVGIFFEGENIVRRSFFVFDTRYPISHIRRVRFDSNEDSFGATNPFVTIEFKNGKRFLLFSFVTVDLYRIIDRIRSSASEAVDTGLIKNINDAADKE